MFNENEIVSSTYKNSIQFRVNKHIYALESARAAAYKFTDHFFILIEPDAEDFYCVRLQPKNPVNPPDLSALVSEFKNEMLDQQVRIDLANRFGSLREIVVESAFRPINTIGDKNDRKY